MVHEPHIDFSDLKRNVWIVTTYLYGEWYLVLEGNLIKIHLLSCKRGLLPTVVDLCNRLNVRK